VGRLPFSVTQAQLKEYFQQFGDVTDCYLPLNHLTHEPRGIAFVTFARNGMVDEVMASAHQVNGQLLAVDRAEPKGAVVDISTRTNYPLSKPTSQPALQYLIDPTTGFGNYYNAAPVTASSPLVGAPLRSNAFRAGTWAGAVPSTAQRRYQPY
jgi:RNA recognition motif-containing protein